MEKTLATFQKAIEEEIESLKGLILETTWDKSNYETLINICKLLEEHKLVLLRIKQHKRGLI